MNKRLNKLRTKKSKLNREKLKRWYGKEDRAFYGYKGIAERAISERMWETVIEYKSQR